MNVGCLRVAAASQGGNRPLIVSQWLTLGTSTIRRTSSFTWSRMWVACLTLLSAVKWNVSKLNAG